MRKPVVKPPRLVYSVIGETGEHGTPSHKTWHALSVSAEIDAIKAANGLNSILFKGMQHYDNYETGSDVTELLRSVDKIVESVKPPGARYSIIRYKYDEAKDNKRLPPGAK